MTVVCGNEIRRRLVDSRTTTMECVAWPAGARREEQMSFTSVTRMREGVEGGGRPQLWSHPMKLLKAAGHIMLRRAIFTQVSSTYLNLEEVELGPARFFGLAAGCH